MRKFALYGALAASLLTAPCAFAAPRATAAAAGTMTCPIGGATFSYKPAPPGAGIGLRPDGKPYGSGHFPTILPECPDNGLILYKDYSPAEVAKLTPLVASEDYQALRRETQYYRAYWLMKQMGLGPERYLWALLQASWEAESRPELRARYLAELADESAKADPQPNDLNWIGMEARSINALRELGRFDDASGRLAKVPLDALQPAAGGATSADAVKRTWLTYFEQLKAAIERKDSAIEPYEMIPRQLALNWCIDRAAGLDSHQKGFCEREKAAVDETRAARANNDLKVLSRPRSESGR